MSWSAFIGHGLAHEGMRGGFGVVGTAASYATNSLLPIEAPSLEQLIDLALRGWISEQTLKDGALLRGVTLDTSRGPGLFGENPEEGLNVVWKKVFWSKQTLPTEKEFLEIANRQFWTDGRVNDGLKRYGYYTDSNRQWVGNLRYDIPGPSDLVRFSVRHVWEPDLLAALGYDKEFPGAVIDVWHSMKGLDYPLFAGGPFAEQLNKVGGEGYAAQLAAKYASEGVSEPTWAKAYWWSHWVLPSPGQGYEMMFRLRPDRDPKYDPPEAVGQNFSFKDLELLLRANDYPKKFRPLLAAIAHRMPGVRFIRDFRKQGVYDFRAVLEWALRWGYSEQDALDIASDIERNVLATEEKKTSCRGCATCDQAFDVGILSQDDLAGCYVGYGLPEADAAKMAGLADLKLRTKRHRELVANLRKRYLKGTLSIDQVGRMLGDAGIVQGRIDAYLADWQLEFEAGRKEISASQAVRYACRGIISVPDLVARLTNLGYPVADQEALVSEAAMCAANLATTAVEKLARQDRQAKADAYSAARRARQSLVEAQRYLASHGTPKNLHDWFCAGNIGEPEVYTRLSALGWPDVDITRFLSDCKSGKKPAGTGGGKTPVIPPLIPPNPEAQAIEQLP